MKVFRATNVVAVSYMEDKFLESVNLSKEVRIEQLKYMMLNEPASTFVLQAFEGEELISFLIAYAPVDQLNILLTQAWCDNKVEGRKLQDSMFLKLCLWGESIDRVRITAETTRDVDALYRRWGFEETVKIVTFKLDGDFEASLMKTHKDYVKTMKDDKKINDSPIMGLSEKGNDNGRTKQCGNNPSVVTIEGSKKSIKTTVKSPTSEPGKAPCTISGSIRSGSDISIPTSGGATK